jgi:phosphoribosyl 1,2-cyclic phosphodiesterase
MKFCVLSSGSKGNCTYIEIGNHKFLIDVGTNFLYTSTKLNEIGVEPEEIEAVFITHIHEDHIAGLKRFIKMVNPIIYLTKKIYENIPVELTNYEIIEDSLNIEEIFIDTIKLSHDTPECRGYIFEYQGKQIVYITDTGYINIKHHKRLENKTVYIIESNHDIDMLMNSNRYRPLKMRILGDEGHISNKDCAYYLSKFVGEDTRLIVLAHLSEEANTPTLALETVKKEIKDVDIILAKQNERIELIEI